MIDLTPFRADLEHVCQELRVQRLDVVGSAARDDFSAASDIDVLVTFRDDDNLFERYFSLKAKLEALFQRKVDIIEERAIRNPFFKRAIEKNRISVYGT
jgi:predicted nucleotidyltransferase